jgi:hypothetical protein
VPRSASGVDRESLRESGDHPMLRSVMNEQGLTAYHAVKKSIPLLYPGTHAVGPCLRDQLGGCPETAQAASGM